MSNVVLVWAVILVCYISLIPYYFVSVDRTSSIALYLIKYFPFLLTSLFFPVLLLTNESLRRSFFRLDFSVYIFWSITFAGCISAIGAYSSKFVLLKAVYMACTSILPFIIICTLCQIKDVFKVVNCIAIVSILVCVYGIYSNLTGFDVVFGDVFDHGQHHKYYRWNAISTVGNPSILGTYLLLCFPFTVVMISSYVRTYLLCNLLIVVSSVVFLFGTSVTYSRGAILSFTVTYIVVFFKVLNRRDKLLHITLTILFSFILCAVIFLQDPNFFESVLSKVSAKLNEAVSLSGTLAYRLEIASSSFSLWFDNPFIGIGLGHSTEFFGNYFPDHQTDANAIDNQFLTILVETGFVGLCAHIATFSYVLYLISGGGLLADKSSVHSRSANSLAWACVASLIGIHFSMLSWDALNFPTIRILCWIVIGIGLNLSSYNAFEKK